MTINAARAKNINRSRVLNIIRKKSRLSRREIAEDIGLSAPAVGYLVAELIEQGLVVEQGRRTNMRGQPAIELELNPPGAHALGLQLKRNEVVGVMVNLLGEVKAKKVITQNKMFLPSKALEVFTEIVEELYIASTYNNFLGVGLATFGPLDLELGTVNASHISAHWSNVPLRDLLATSSGLTVYMDNDATAAAIGEHWYGIGQSYNNYLFIDISEGIGGGFFINSQAYRGSSLNAGEFGYTLVSHNGKVQFLEEVAGMRACANRLGQKYNNNTLKRLETAFGQGDKTLLDCLDDTSKALAQAIVSADNLLDLDAIIFGGQLSQEFLKYMLEKAKKYCEPLFMRDKPRRATMLLGQTGKLSAALGAATLAIYDTFVIPANPNPQSRVFHSEEVLNK